MKYNKTYTSIEELLNTLVDWNDVFFIPKYYKAQFKDQQPLTIDENATHATITVNVPGFSKESLALEQQDNALMITGKSTPNKPPKPFSYKVQLSNIFDFKNIQATVKHGLLTVVVPKIKTKSPLKITIN